MHIPAFCRWADVSFLIISARNVSAGSLLFQSSRNKHTKSLITADVVFHLMFLKISYEVNIFSDNLRFAYSVFNVLIFFSHSALMTSRFMVLQCIFSHLLSKKFDKTVFSYEKYRETKLNKLN